ncbi:GNAT family N-acetyltransferase [Paenibacillus chitinolyticus]
MLLGLYTLDYQPGARECYIADVVVHPDYRGQGVGKLLLQWPGSLPRRTRCCWR